MTDSRRSATKRFEHRPLPAAPQGKLRDHSLADLLRGIHADQLSGTLRVRNDPVEKLIYILEGKPAYVESDLRSETLGAYLRRSGRLSEVDHRLVFEQMRQTGRRQGELIIEMGLLTPHELYDAMLQHIVEKVISCFAWEDGEFEIEHGSDWSDHILDMKIDPLAVIREGIKRHFTDERMKPLPGLPGHGRAYFRTDMVTLERDVELDTGDARIRDLVSRALTLDEIVAQSRAERSDVMRTLYGLYVLHYVGFEVGGRPRPSKQPPARPEPGGEESDDVGVVPLAPSGGVEAQAEALTVDYLRLKAADYFTILGIDRNATTSDVHEAFRRESPRFQPDAVADLPLRLQQQADELFTKVVAAYRVLANPDERIRYIAALEKGHGQRQPAVEALECDDLFRKAKQAIDDESPADACEALQEALQLKPGEPLFLVWLAWARFLSDPRGQRKRAETRLELTRRSNPEMPEPYLFMARILELEGNNDRALQLYEEAAAKAPGDLDLAREAQLFTVRLKHGRTRKLPAPPKPDSALNQDVGQLLSRLFSKD